MGGIWRSSTPPDMADGAGEDGGGMGGLPVEQVSSTVVLCEGGVH